MNHDPFKGAKRQWKRIDPEPPPPDRSFREWEFVVWTVTVIVGVVLLAVILGNITAPAQTAPPPRHHARTQR